MMHGPALWHPPKITDLLTAPGGFPVPSKTYKTMTQKKKYIIIAACCIVAGVWFNHEEATAGEWIASLLSAIAAGVACYRAHLEILKEEKTSTPSTPNK